MNTQSTKFYKEKPSLEQLVHMYYATDRIRESLQNLDDGTNPVGDGVDLLNQAKNLERLIREAVIEEVNDVKT